MTTGNDIGPRTRPVTCVPFEYQYMAGNDHGIDVTAQ